MTQLIKHHLPNNYAVKFSEQMQMAEVFVKSGVFQDVEDAAQAVVKIAKGAELGLPPVTSLESIDILKVPGRDGGKGRVSLFLRAHACAALVRASGYGDYEVQHSDGESCSILFRKRTPAGWVTLPVVTYTLDLARRNRLVRQGSQWESDPENMLYQRTMKRGTERYFPELVKGLQVTEDLPEVSDATMQKHMADVWDERPSPFAEEDVEPGPGEVEELPRLTPASFRATLDKLTQSIGLSPGAVLPMIQRKYKIRSWDDLTDPAQQASVLKALRENPRWFREQLQKPQQAKKPAPPPSEQLPPSQQIYDTLKATLDLTEQALDAALEAHAQGTPLPEWFERLQKQFDAAQPKLDDPETTDGVRHALTQNLRDLLEGVPAGVAPGGQ